MLSRRVRKELRNLNPNIPKVKGKGVTSKVAKKITKAGTYDKKGNAVTLKKGYQVSTQRPELTNPEADKLGKRYMKKKPYSVGGWLSNGEVSAEPSFTVSTKKEAMKLAKQFNQEAIFDNKKQQIITNKGFKDNVLLMSTSRGQLIRTQINNLIKKNAKNQKPQPEKPKIATRPEIKKGN